MELRTAQKEFLKNVDESRKKGNKKGLLIFATGLGKTLASLSDALKVAGKNGKILILAHNHNLLHQHAKDFKLLNKKKKIGFLYKSKKDVNAEVLFANIMTLKNKKYLYSFEPNEFDYIIIDETHHAGAKSYKCIFDYFKPKFLLGMTATPNRTDQIDILPMYDNNIIHEINTFEAINKGWLRPYKYVFLWDKWCDYDEIKSYRAKNGFHKYNVGELGRAYFIPERDKAIVEEFKKRAIDRKGIGFCVSVKESIRMAKLFNDSGINSVAIWGSSTKGMTMNEKKRNKILEDFSKGKYQIIFNCEIIGEGLHLPLVDVVLKLRPTQSLIKDSQHNGRGLFNIDGLESENKYKKLLILDWVGNYNNVHLNYIYQGKPTTKTYERNRDIRDAIKLPLGCDVEFDGRVIKEFNEQYNNDRINVYQKQVIKNRYKDGEKVKNIAEDFGCSMPTILRILRSLGVKTNNFAEKNELIKEFYNVKLRLKRKPLRKDMDKYGKFSHIQYVTRFGSWNKFLISIDEEIRYFKSEDVTQEDLIKNFYNVKKIVNDKIRRQDLNNRNISKYGITLYQSHFGSWNKFLIKYEPELQRQTLGVKLEKYNEIYKSKPIIKILRANNPDIYDYFRRHKVLDKYCLPPVSSINDMIKKYNEIYKEKPTRRVLQINNPKIYSYFYRYGLLDKYCMESRTKKGYTDTSRETKIIRKYHEIYKEKPSRGNLSKDNSMIHKYFLKHGLLDKYCLPTLKNSVNDIVKKYNKFYKEKPSRNNLRKDNHSIYECFRRYKLLDKYCLPKYYLSKKEKLTKKETFK